MPTEHEYKYVISLDLLNHYSSFPRPISMANIQQGYVAVSEGAATRIRHITKDGESKWILTFKQKVGDRQIEVEKELDARDGWDLWSVSSRIVEKTRYFFDHKNMIWELDLFHRPPRPLADIYFILAEVELPEGAERPKDVPDFLKKHILYEVDLTDERFSNKKLGNVHYATNLYMKVKEGVIDGN